MTGFDVIEYWEGRYGSGCDSGCGSRGEAAQRKADYVNAVIEQYGVRTLVDWGCGDGEVAARIRVPRYVGVDVSETALALCRARNLGPGYEWICYDGRNRPDVPQADLHLSLDVIFHLVDGGMYRRYMSLVFDAPLVCVHSSCRDEQGYPHVLHRRFIKDVPNGYVVMDKPEHEEEIGMWLFKKEEGKRHE